MRRRAPLLPIRRPLHLRHERADHTHEADLRLNGRRWQDRTHFIAAAARVMRRILIDLGRHHRSLKRGAGQAAIPIAAHHRCTDQSWGDLDEALTRLAAFAPRPAQVVEMRFFGGMTEDEIAGHLAVCSRTVKRDWLVAKAWLYGELATGSNRVILRETPYANRGDHL